MKNYILQNNEFPFDFPLVLYGDSGCGKTAILAKFTSQVIF